MIFRRAAKAVAIASLLCTPALADDATIADFAGQWVGKVTVETISPTDFPASGRESGVTVTPDAKGGFMLEWSTVKHERGDPDRPEEAVGDTELTFTATAPARWSAGPGNPVAGQALWTARLEDRTLTVVGYTIMKDGRAEMQTYQRTLDGDAMALNYTRVVDGMVVRRAAGGLTRFAQ